ncbi:MAG: isopentenyl phosphate kinase [bacterium]|nr:isopentenyl phosphate kinase [bacterium]
MEKNNKNVILIKLGGSVITDKNTPYKARVDMIKRLAVEIKSSQITSLVLAHGSGSFAHTSAQKYGGKKGYKSKWGVAKVARDAMEINRIVMNIFIEEGLPAVSLRPMSMMIASAGKLKKDLFEIIEETISQGLIPVVYGDVIWDKKWKSTIYSGETTLSKIGLYLSKKGYRVNKIIQVGETNGVYDDKGKTISSINRKNWRNIKRYVFKNNEADVTGGMEHKIENALTMADSDIKTFLINGSIIGELSKAFLGKTVKGTVVQ